MALPLLRLSHPTLDDLDFSASGWYPQSFDPGAAATRDELRRRPDASGAADTTSLTGERVCTLTVFSSPSDASDMAGMDDLLRAFLSPRIRPTLHWTRPGTSERVATGRGLPLLAPVDAAPAQVLVAQWVIPSGIWESAELHEISILAGTPGSAGVEFDPTVEFGPTIEFPFADAPGLGYVTNAGNAETYPVLRAYGPFGGSLSTDNVTIGNQTTGKALVFAGLNVLAGEFVEIDTREKTIRLNADPAQSLYHKLDFGSSEWWSLVPGENAVTFQPETFSGVAQLVVVYRDAWA